jgi:hypothetical protein
MKHLLELKKEIDTTESLLSIYIYNKKISEVINFFEEQLEKAKKISNPIKKHKINNRLFNFIGYLKNNIEQSDDNTIINKIYFINDSIKEYNLTKKEVEVANLYNFINIFYKCDSYYYIDYFIDLFYNLDLYYYIKINKSELFVNEFNKNKERNIFNCKISNELKIIEEYDNIRKKYKDIIIIYGNSMFINKIKNMEEKFNNIYITNEFLSKESCYEVYENELMNKNYLLLDNRLKELSNEKCNTDIYVFGKLKMEIKEAIESYLLKELYIEDKKLEKLKTFIDESYFNFKIIPIKSLKDGDIGFQFIKDYNGIMGIKYF